MKRDAFLLATMGAALTACSHRSAPTAHFEDIAADGQPLKDAFNADAGEVRILMLVSPT